MDFFIIIATTFLNGEWDGSFNTTDDNLLTETFQTHEACETRLVERWLNNNPPPPFPDNWEGTMEKDNNDFVVVTFKDTRQSVTLSCDRIYAPQASQ